MKIDIADVTVHIDETLDHEQLEGLAVKMHKLAGVVSLGVQDKTPRLMIVGYAPHVIRSRHVLDGFTAEG